MVLLFLIRHSIPSSGLSSAIEVADICLKSANITLIGYELSKGNGMVVIKIEGDVGAVTAAIQASSKAGKIYSIYTILIISLANIHISYSKWHIHRYHHSFYNAF